MKFEKSHSLTTEDVSGPTNLFSHQDYQNHRKYSSKSFDSILRTLSDVLDNAKKKNRLAYDSDNGRLYNISNKIFKKSKERNLQSEKIKEFKEVLKSLNKKYDEEFYGFSQIFEKLAAQRRMLLKKLENVTNSLKHTKLYCNRSRFVLSSFSLAASLGSILLIDRNFLWSSKMFFFSLSVGGLSFISNLVEIYSTNLYTEDVIKSLREDMDSLESLERSIRYSLVDDRIYGLFPYGVSKEIARAITLEAIYSIDECSPPNTVEQIFCTIILSNDFKDQSLVHDEEFVAKVRIFCESPLAVKWWIRFNYKHSKFYADKMKLYNQLKSYLKLDYLSAPFITLATVPLSTNNYLLPALSTAILSGLITFETYCELFIDYPSNELIAMSRLKSILTEEFKELNELYDGLNPYND